MNDSTIARLYEEAAENLLLIAAAIRNQDRNGKNLTERMIDAQVGHLRSPTLEAGAGSAPDDSDLPDELRGQLNYTDPTGTAGVQVASRGDRARSELDRIRRSAPRLAKEARSLVETAGRYNPRQANKVERLEDDAEEGCVSCARVTAPSAVGDGRFARPWWNPVARHVTLADGSVAALCEWCRVQARASGSLPEKADVESYRDTGRARRRVG